MATTATVTAQPAEGVLDGAAREHAHLSAAPIDRGDVTLAVPADPGVKPLAI